MAKLKKHNSNNKTRNSLFEEIGNFFEHDTFMTDIFNSNFYEAFAPDDLTKLTKAKSFCSRVPITANSKEDILTVKFDVPGFDKDDLEISFNENTKLLTVENLQTGKEEAKNKIKYTYLLKGYDPETFDASCSKGILIFTAKKHKEKSNTKKILIK